MAATDYSALVRAWRGGDEPASAVPALLAALRTALGAASVAAWRTQGTDAGAPSWRDPPTAPAAEGDVLEWALRADGEVHGRLRIAAPPDVANWPSEARELGAFAAELLAQGLSREQLRRRNARLAETGDLQQAILDGA